MVHKLEETAEAAYNYFRERYPDTREWAAIPHQHVWRDLVLTYFKHLGVEPPNFTEECAKRAVTEALKPEVETPVEMARRAAKKVLKNK